MHQIECVEMKGKGFFKKGRADVTCAQRTMNGHRTTDPGGSDATISVCIPSAAGFLTFIVAAHHPSKKIIKVGGFYSADG